MTAPVPEELQTALGSSYVLERELGRGGMATVYLARDTKHLRHVALKVLHPELAASLGPERFRREITTAAQLQHPHILSVFDSGDTAGGQLWFSMPYVEGESLCDRLRRERQLPIDDAVRITREVASALAHAHARGVLHRDIKPENILLTREGDALLADFGIARALGGEAGIDTLTGSGFAIGTPQYMSPEQASGEPTLDARSDVYSLGAVLYEMLAGEPPFTGPTPQAIAAKLLSSDAPSVRKSRHAVPGALDATLRRALAPVPADRWASAGEFARALEIAERTASSTSAASPRRVPTAVLALGLGFAVGIGVLFAWRAKVSSSAASSSSDIVRLAVLPFDNVGDSTDAYFADGMTEAVRDKLTGLPGLEVIGSASSRQYRGTTKTPQQIGRELGVRYLLEGRVRWAKGPDGAGRVRVSPELVDARSAVDKWAQPFDAPLTDVFQVQADIAGKVAQALQVALTPAAQHLLAARPTANLLAYDAYLRGEALAEIGNAPVVLRRMIGAYRDAVARDSNFALAWSALGEEYSMLYYNSVADSALADSADQATARALTLAPDLPEAHAARAGFYFGVRNDNTRALAQAEAGLVHGPNAALLTIAASAEESLGRSEDAAAHAAQAAALDPRDPAAFYRVARLALRRRQTTEAQTAYERARSLAPGNMTTISGRAEVALQRGDLAGARSVLHAAPLTVDPAAFVAYVAQFDDLGWVLDSAREAHLLTLRPDAFDNDTGEWAIVLAQQYSFRGDRVRLLAYADTARTALETQVRASPKDYQRHAFLGLALAYLGRGPEAIEEGERAVALRSIGQDAVDGPYYEHQLARIYLLTGHPDRALDQLERLLKEPYFLTPAWLKIDPNFAPLRGNPRFERLLADGEKPIA